MKRGAKKEEGGGQEEGEKRRRGYDSFGVVAARVFVKKKKEVCARTCSAHVALSTSLTHHTHALDPKMTRKEGNIGGKRGKKLRLTEKGY